VNDNEGIIVATVAGFFLAVFLIIAALTRKEPCTGYGGHWEDQNCQTHRHFVCRPSIQKAELACNFEKRTRCDKVCVGASE